MFNLEYIRHASSFFALQVPIYYYVKTRGSLASQAMSISKTVRMKLMMFDYYNQFYKSVLDEDAYEKSRLKVYRFLFDAAQDGAALPGSIRLGNERTHVPASILTGEGLLYDLLRERKLLDYYLEPAALKNALSLPEASLLLHLRQAAPGGRKELAAFAGLSRSTFSMLLQRLAGKGLVAVSESRRGGDKILEIAFPPASEPLLADLESAWQDFEAARLSGFSGAEREQYARMTGRIQENIREILQ